MSNKQRNIFLHQHHNKRDTESNKPQSVHKDSKNWISRLLLTVAITFIISSIGGAYFQDYLTRSKPSVLLSVIEFSGDDQELLNVTPQLKLLSRKIGWSRALSLYEKYGALKEIESNLRAAIKELEIAQENTIEWIKLASLSEKKNQALLLAKSFPYHTTDTFAQVINGMINRKTLNKIDDDLDKSKWNSIHDELKENELLRFTRRQVEVRLTTSGTIVPLPENYSKSQKSIAKKLAVSMALPDIDKLRFFAKEYMKESTRLLKLLPLYIGELQNILKKNAFIHIGATLINSGGQAEIVLPHAKLQCIVDKKLSNAKSIITYDLAVEKKSQFAYAIAQLKLAQALILKQVSKGDRKRDTVYVESLFNQGKVLSYLLLPPQKTVEINLKSITKTSNDFKSLFDLYESSLLRCSIEIKTLSGAKLESKAVNFGAL